MGVNCSSGQMREKALPARHLTALPECSLIGECVSPSDHVARDVRRMNRPFFSIPQRNESSDLVGARVRWFASFRASFVALTLLLALTPGFLPSREWRNCAAGTTATPSTIVIGFVGAFCPPRQSASRSGSTRGANPADCSQRHLRTSF